VRNEALSILRHRADYRSYLAVSIADRDDARLAPMTVTLETLREQFEGTRSEWNRLVGSGRCFDPEPDVAATWSDELVYDDEGHHVPDSIADPRNKMVVAARRYIIAREFNLTDLDQIEMVWKLQNGGAL
jgi:hypothetical protein